jgi:hypothetical protein
MWGTLASHFKKCGLSASRPLVRRTVLDRAVVPRLQLSELSALRVQRRVGARYFLTTDISQFYPSFYTHSVPWALHSKAHGKAHRKGTPAANLDQALRRQQWGQTVGIPIGPDASLIAAEIVLTAVDVSLVKRFKKLVGFRYVDDYELSFATLRDAEQVLADLEGLLAQYELVLNPRKTRILEAPCELEANWVSELRQFALRDDARTLLNDTIDLFNRALALAAQNREDAVLRYALERAKSIQLAGRGQRTFHALILGAASAEPSTLPVALGLLYREVEAGRDPAKAALARTFDSIIERNAPLARGSEVAWCLWGALRFGVRLSERAAKRVYRMSDDVVALLALHAESKDLIPKRAVDHDLWLELTSRPDALHEEHWLLAYEAAAQGWLGGNAAVTRDPFFAALHKADIRFYDDTQVAVAPAFSGAAAAIPGGKLPFDYF